MRYSVELINEFGPTAEYCNVSKKEAIKAARKESSEGRKVFVCWFRSSDGQKGYLNPDGDHAVMGESW